MNTARVLRTLLACAFLAASSAGASPTAPTPLPTESVYQLPVQLTDQHGHRFDWSRRRGTPQLVAMFYTSCKFTCPLIVDSGKAVEHALTPGQKRNLGILLISMDPKRDNPAALMAVVRKRSLDNARWSLTSPDLADVSSVAGVLGVRYRQLANGDFNHTSVLLLLDKEGRIVARTEKVGSVLDPDFVASVRALVGQIASR